MTQVDAGDQLELLRQTVAALRKARASLAALQQERAQPIAIIGAACRLPGGVDSLAGYWDLLRQGRDGIVDVPADRWQLERYFDPDPEAPGRTYARRIGALADIAGFDAPFFGISPREAAAMDPQQRLLLEVTWEALQHAGLDPSRLEGTRTGVFIGMCSNDYAESAHEPERIDMYSATGSSVSVAAGRISYALGAHGPSLVVDTACSSSLAALHLAVESLRTGESELAIVGGVNAIVSPSLMIGMAKLKALSPSARCASFAADADGYVRGEGCAAVVLKRMGDARAARDRVLARILATAVNQDGRSNGLTAPSGVAQEKLLREALVRAGLRADQIAYVEAHGTGTKLGDPIELRALNAVLGRERTRPLIVGSVKSNIGHLEAAAGMAGLLKTVLVLRERTVPPNLHVSELNPHVPWSQMSVRIPSEALPLAADEPLHAGVSSFGFSGTNAHVILGEETADAAADPAAVDRANERYWILALSAKTQPALTQLAARYRKRIAGRPADECRDVCFTATACAAGLDERACVVAEGRAALERGLLALEQGRPRAGVVTGRRMAEPGAIAFVFSGHGGQWPGMGSELMAAEPAFRRSVERCAAALARYVAWEPLALLDAQPGAVLDALERVDVAQPLIFTIQVALAELLIARGVRPEAVVGHSVGEVAAAHVCGALTLEDAARIVCERSRLLEAMAGRGAMLSVGLDAAALEPLLAEYGELLSLAAINGPSTSAVSGDRAAIDALEQKLRTRDVLVKRVKINSASHCAQLDGHLPALRERIGAITPAAANAGFVSSVYGRRCATIDLDQDYWLRNLRQTVRFVPAIESLLAEDTGVFIEIGPSPVVLDGVLELLQRAGGERLALASLRRNGEARRDLLELVAQLHVRGLSVDFRAFGLAGGIADVPPYPWQHRRHWLASGWDGSAAPARSPESTAIESSLGDATFTESLLDLARAPWLQEHVVGGTAVLAGAFFVDAALNALGRFEAAQAIALCDVSFERSLPLASTGATRVQVAVDRSGASPRIRISSRPEAAVAHDRAPWELHVKARAGASEHASAAPAPEGLERVRRRCPDRVDPSDLYARYERRGLSYGPAFRTVHELLVGDGEALARVRTAEAQRHGPPQAFAPSLLDGCFQAVGALARDDELWVPIRIGRFDMLRARAPFEVWSHVRRYEQRGDRQSADIDVYDADGALVAAVRGLEAKRLARAPSHAHDALTYGLTWRRRERSAPHSAAAAAGRWIVIGVPSGLGAAVAGGLACAGHDARIVDGTPAAARDAAAFTALDRQLEQLAGDSVPIRGVVHVAALSPPDSDLERRLTAIAGSLLYAVQALLRTARGRLPRLWVVTAGAQPVGAGVVDPVQAVLWGMANTIGAEHPELATTLVDIEQARAADAGQLVAELLSDGPERHVAVRGDGRYVARVEPLRVRSQPREQCRSARDLSFCLEIDSPGRLDTLALRSRELPAPGDGQVLVAVRAAGLNFADVMRAMGFFGDSEGDVALGTECAGEVVALGPGVAGVSVGDRVSCIASRCIGTHVIAPARLVWRVPEHVNLAQAATLPTAYMTAWHALLNIARLHEGQRILIHSASGGTGLAACAIARNAGAEILATAGTEAKRSFLRGQGIEHVFDSRTLEFVDQTLAATGGDGVDVVLNSLSGRALEASLRVVAADGMFLELGKRDIYADGRLSMEHFKRRIGVSAIDMAGLHAQRPQRFARIFADVMRAVDARELPVLPVETFSVAEVQTAFRRMSAGQHLGKIAIELDGGPGLEIRVRTQTPFAASGAYLITGGFGDLGLELARFLVARGARNLVLLGRTAPRERARAVIDELRRSGARVVAETGDVADLQQVQAITSAARVRFGRLQGVFHLAAVLRDATVANQTWSSFLEVLRPKLRGALNLHLATLDDQLDCFVMYSSTAALLPSGGQANYAAANAFLDAFAHYRRAQGLAATAVAWGPLAEIGLAARSAPAGHWSERGVGSILAAQSHELLEQILAAGLTHCAAVPLDPQRWIAAHPHALACPLYEELTRLAGTQTAAPGSWPRRIAQAAAEQRPAVLRALINERVSAVLRVEPDEVPDRVAFADMGVNSLAAVELRNGLSWALETALPDTVLWKHPTVEALARHLAERWGEPSRAAGQDTPAAEIERRLEGSV